MLKAVIFDMDGVIVDSEATHSKAYEAVLSEYGIEAKKDAHGIVHTPGFNAPDNWERLKKIHNMDIDTHKLIMRKRQLMFEAMETEGIAAIPGVRALLEDLKQNDIRLGIASSAIRIRLDIVIKKLGLENYFEITIAGDEVKHGKPAPDLYLEAMAGLGVLPGECVVIEDAINGIRAAKSAGIKVIAVPTQFTHRADFSVADMVVKSLDDLNWAKIAELVV